MWKKLSTSEFIEEVKRRGNSENVDIIGEYSGADNKILVKCKDCGLEFLIKATKLYYRACCKNCKKDKERKELFLEKLKDKNKFTVYGDFKISDSKIKFKCNKCGHIFTTDHYKILKWKHCPKCLEIHRNTHSGHSDFLCNTDPDISNLLLDKNKSKIYTRCSARKVKWKCPNCGNIFEQVINKIINRGFKCPKCSTSYSFPNRFVYSVLDSANIDFKPEHIFSWSNFEGSSCYRYDFYIESKNTIIEVMGKQHYPFEGNFYNQSYDDIHANDIKKEKLAKENGIKNYIKINARYSDLNFIKNSLIQNEEFCNLFDANSIDWNYTLKNLCDTFVKDVYDFFMKNPESTTSELCREFKVGARRITTAINIAVDSGLSKENLINMLDKNWKEKMSNRFSKERIEKNKKIC